MKKKLGVLLLVVALAVSLGLVPAPVGASPGPGLVALWHLDGDATDDSGNGNNGAAMGTPTWVDDQWGGKALSCSGDDYVVVADDDDLSPGSAVALEAWIYPTDTSGIHIIAGKWNDNLREYELMLWDGEIIFYGFGTDTGWKWVRSSSTLNANNWYHVAGVWDGSFLRVYINGSADGSRPFAPAAGIPNTNARFTIGAQYWGSAWDRHFDGLIDEVRIWDTANPVFNLDVSPDEDFNLVDTGHTITATVTIDGTDDGEEPAPGVEVNFDIDGPNSASSGTAMTDSNGEATFTYTGDGGAGIDTIAVSIDQDCYQYVNVDVEKYWVDKYVEISGVIAGDLDNYGDKGKPTYTFQGFAGDAGGTAVGSITINYKHLGVICTFTPDSGTFGIADAPSIDPGDVVDDERGDLRGWSFTCTNGDTGTANVYMLDRDAGAVLLGGFAPRGAIVVDIQTGDNRYQIGSTAPQWIPLDRGNIHVVDLS